MAPITKKTTGSAMPKLGTGFRSSAIGKSGSLGGSKASNVFGSSAKSGKSMNYSEKTGSFFGASSKNSTSEKKTNFQETKPSAAYSSSAKTSSFLSPNAKATAASAKPTNVLSLSPKTAIPLGSSGKSASFSPPKEKGTNPFAGKTSQYDVSHNYPSFINAKANKPTASFGVIWLPTRKHKKKETVYHSHNYDNYKRSPSMFNYMSGDSPDFQAHKKKEEEALLVPDRPKLTSVAVNTGITAANIDIPPDSNEKVNPEEKQEFIRRESEENKDAAGDSKDRDDKSDKDYLENKDNTPNNSEKKWDNDKQKDNVDSVYLRPPPPHKARITPPANEEEDCGIKCLYYTLQCCDCVLQ